MMWVRRFHIVIGPNYRKRLIINPRFQYTFLGYMILFSISITTVMLASAYYYYEVSIGEGMAFGFEADHMFFEYLKEQYYELNTVVIGAAAVSTLVLIFGGLMLSHRIVGPIHRFKIEMKKIGDSGELHEVKFRKNDYFKDLAETFNHEIQRFLEKKNDSNK